MFSLFISLVFFQWIIDESVDFAILFFLTPCSGIGYVDSIVYGNLMETGEPVLQLGSELEFGCVEENCDAMVRFSVLDTAGKKPIKCKKCKREYTFGDELLHKLKLFEHLVRTLHESESILSTTNVEVDVHGYSVRIPFRLLLTRLNTELNLQIGGKDVHIHFRISPLNDVKDK